MFGFRILDGMIYEACQLKASGRKIRESVSSILSLHNSWTPRGMCFYNILINAYSYIWCLCFRNKLIPSAVPTLVDVPNPPPTLQSKRKAPAVRHPIPIPTKMKKLSNEPYAVDDGEIIQTWKKYLYSILSCVFQILLDPQSLLQLHHSWLLLWKRKWVICREETTSSVRSCPEAAIRNPGRLPARKH